MGIGSVSNSVSASAGVPSGGSVACAGNNVAAEMAQQSPAPFVLGEYYGDGVTLTISNTGRAAALSGTSQISGSIGAGSTALFYLLS